MQVLGNHSSPLDPHDLEPVLDHPLRTLPEHTDSPLEEIEHTLEEVEQDLLRVIGVVVKHRPHPDAIDRGHHVTKREGGAHPWKGQPVSCRVARIRIGAKQHLQRALSLCRQHVASGQLPEASDALIGVLDAAHDFRATLALEGRAVVVPAELEALAVDLVPLVRI